ncbi:MAG: nicotinate-nucleotide adenylyltransferase [Desulfuromonadaceae bacterium]|nr:nicotinate-nucleotide adenylyltransferase [Desulfuromonadaceae bacterium]MDD2854271.1 nicotinate-nucleotide adenylyltransferase [Desulfuromonadaceae bacterium]
MRTGLLGGSFNPIHNAHLRIAGEAQAECNLDRIIFIPAADPPHKPIAGEISFEQRSGMVKRAIAGRADFEISLIEAERSGKSYSIDTIRIFRELYPYDALFFIIGGDSFLEIGTWRCFGDIFSNCNLIVVERPGFLISDRINALPESVRERFHLDGKSGRLLHDSGHSVTFVTGSPMELSSTEIRQLAAAGADISKYVPPDVAEYISQQRIYTDAEKNSEN